MQRKLATIEAVLNVWDACISELTEEVKDQQSGAWSWARLDTLRAHCDGKLLKEKVAKEIADLVSYFDENEESGGEDAASTTQVTGGRLSGELSVLDAGTEEWVADEEDEAEDDEWLSILPFTLFCLLLSFEIFVITRQYFACWLK